MEQHIKIVSRLVENAYDITRNDSLDYSFKSRIAETTIGVNISIVSRISMGEIKFRFKMNIDDVMIHHFSLTSDRKASITNCFNSLDEKMFGERNEKISKTHKLYELIAEHFNIKL